MSTIRVVNIQHPDSVDPNVILNTDGTVTISGLDTISVSGTAEFASDVGIGTSSPAGTLNVVGTGAAPSLIYDTANLVNLDQGGVQLAIGVDSAAPFGGFIQARDNANGARSILLNPATGNVGIGMTNPIVALDVSGEVRASTGILFGTDTAAANTLDDYEEGTWVPIVAGATTQGTASYNFQDGSYEKIGRQVTLRGFIDWTSHTGTGVLEIRGLPFPSFAGTFDFIQTGSIMVNNVVFPAGYTMATAYMPNGSTAMKIFLSGSSLP